MLRNSTQIPNTILDNHIRYLKPSEILVLLVIVRQTLGWVTSNGKRKTRDWISQKLFVKKTGLSPRTVSRCVDTLIAKDIIKATDFSGEPLTTSHQRKGKSRIYYQYLFDSKHAKTNTLSRQKLPNTKLTLTKEKQGIHKLSDWERFQQIKGNNDYG